MNSNYENPKYISFIRFDTTGLDPKEDDIIGVHIIKGMLTRDNTYMQIDKYDEFVYTNKPIPQNITTINGITNEMIKNARNIDDVFSDVRDFLNSNACVIAYNTKFIQDFTNVGTKKDMLPNVKYWLDLNSYAKEKIGLGKRSLIEDYYKTKNPMEIFTHLYYDK